MTVTSFFSDILFQNNEKYGDNKLSEKLIAFDFIRGLAVFFMVFVHVLGVYASSPVQDSAFGYIIDFFRESTCCTSLYVFYGCLLYSFF